MQRRSILSIAGIAALGAAMPLLAQPAKVWQVGVLSNNPRPANGAAPEALRQALAALGYVEGTNIAYANRWTDFDSSRLPALAAELVGLKVDLIVALGSPAVEDTKKATATIPIVIAGAGDAVGVGLIASLARPGGNVTGITDLGTELSAKRLELLKEMVPKALRVAMIWNSEDRSMTLRYRETERAARLPRIVVQPLGVRAPDDFEAAFSAMKRDCPDALFMVSDALTTLNRKRVLEFATTNRIPATYERGDLVKDGGLMSYGADVNDNFRRVAFYVDKILKGAKPADLPVEQPTRFYLRINLKTTKVLGLTIPQTLLLRADEVIE